MDTSKNSQLPNSNPSPQDTDNRKPRIFWFASAAILLAVCILLICLSTTADGRSHPVRINEILAANTRYPNADGYCCDYIELYNSANYPLNLTGFQIGTIDGSGRYAFPYGTSIGAKSYLVVSCDAALEGDLYAPFGISRSGGEVLYLIGSSGAIVDSVTTLATDTDQAMLRNNDGTWTTSSSVTPGYANDGPAAQDLYNPGLSPVRITELSSVNNGFDPVTGAVLDWVELTNTGSTAVDISGYILTDNTGNDKFLFPSGTVLAPQTQMIVLCGNLSSAGAPFGLSQFGMELVVLKDSSGRIVEIIETLPMEPGHSMSLQSDGSWQVTVEVTPGYPNTPDGYRACLRDSGAEPGVITINEIMSASQAVLPDASGAFYDWAELYNSGSSAVNLGGWFLSDDPSEPQKWQFPAVEVGAGEYLVIFLSGKDVFTAGELHTSFSLSAGGESLILSSPAGSVLDRVNFGAAETNCSFDCSDSTDPTLTAFPTPGYANDDIGLKAFCAARVPTGPLAIWELMSYNERYLVQPGGDCYDWVELKNVSDQIVNLSDYAITDDTGTPNQFILPDKTLAPGESVVIILSGDPTLNTYDYTHATFSLNAKEDSLFLYRTNGTLIDYVFLRDIPVGSSYGRAEDSGGFYFMEPTPNAPNHDGYLRISNEPTSQIAQGVYTSDSDFTVPLAAEGTIYYTLDGSDPDTSSLVYTGPIQISETTVLRAAAIEPGKMISGIYTATFIVGEPHDIPVVSLVTDPENLWGPDGIYKSGDLAIKEQVRPANVAYLGDDGSFSMDCRINLHGFTTATVFPKKTFALRFLDAYDGMLNYDVFEDGEVTHFRSLLIRNAYESTVSTQMHDALMGQLASEASDTMLSQKYKYVALYLNGEYWGLYAIRERHSAEHYAAYMDVPASTVHTVRYCIDEQNSLNRLYQFLGWHNLKTKENYDYACTVLDMESFADWIIFESYVCNIDINGNIRYYYCSEDQLWHLGLADLDLGMFNYSGFRNTATTFHHGRLVYAVMANEEFQHLIATRLAELLETTLSDEHVLATLDHMIDTIKNEIILDAERWNYGIAGYNRFVREMREFCDGRAEYLIKDFCLYVNFTPEEKEYYFGHLLK